MIPAIPDHMKLMLTFLAFLFGFATGGLYRVQNIKHQARLEPERYIVDAPVVAAIDGRAWRPVELTYQTKSDCVAELEQWRRKHGLKTRPRCIVEGSAKSVWKANPWKE